MDRRRDGWQPAACMGRQGDEGPEDDGRRATCDWSLGPGSGTCFAMRRAQTTPFKRLACQPTLSPPSTVRCASSAASPSVAPTRGKGGRGRAAASFRDDDGARPAAGSDALCARAADTPSPKHRAGHGELALFGGGGSAVRAPRSLPPLAPPNLHPQQPPVPPAATRHVRVAGAG